MDIKELVKAFNLNNYACNKINTNFTVEGKKIVGLFASNTDTKEYLRGIGEEIIKRHYSGRSEVAGEYYNLNYFPFVNSGKEKDIDENVKKVELTDSTNNEVIRNLKIHFVQEFEEAVGAKVVACLQKEVGITKEEAYAWMEGTVKTGAIGRPYLYCIAFDGKHFKEEGYSLRTFELFKTFYIREFNSRLKECHVKSSDFYEYKDDMLYIKDVSNKVVRSVAEYVKGRVALDFDTPGTEDSKVENFKDVLGDFIFKLTGESINAYGYDVFTDKKKIENGNNFVLVPLTERYSGQLESLKHKDVYKVNIKYKNLMSDIRGKTADPDITNSENPIYAISNKRIAQLLPEIMQSPIAYNQISGRFEFAVDPENFKRRGSSRSSSTVNSPTHAGQSGLRTPPNQRNRDSGIGMSPPKPKDSVAHSSSGDPGPSTGLSDMEWESPSRSQDGALEGSPRQGLVSVLPLNPLDVPGTSGGPLTHLSSIAVSCVVQGPSSSLQSVGAAQNVQAGTSARAQPMDRWSSPAPSAGLWSLPQSRPSSWKGAAQNVQAGTSARAQQPNLWSLPASSAGFPSSKGANKSGSAWTSQPMNLWSLSASSAGFPSSSSSGTSENERSTSKRSADSGHPESPGSLTNERSASVRSTDSGHPESPCPLQFTSEGNIQPMDCLPSQGTLGEEELTINKWMQRKGDKAGANKRRTEPTHETLSKEKEELVKALLYRFNSSNYYRGDVHTNFILENGKIVSELGDGVDRKEYLWKVRNCTINDCVTEEVAKGVYDFGQFPFVFSPDFQRDEEGKIIVAHNIDDAIPNLKVRLIQKFRIQVEEEAAKKLEKMGVTEACERIKESVYLAAKSRDSGVWYIFFDQKRFQRPDFEKFKSIYVEAFKSRWKKCGLDDSLVDYKNDALYIKDAIDINFVKKIEEYEKKEYEKLQASFDYSHEEISPICFPPEGIEGESPIAFDGDQYFLDRDFGSSYESMDCENTERDPLNCKSSSSEGSSSESPKGDSLPLSMLESLSLSNSSHQTGKY